MKNVQNKIYSLKYIAQTKGNIESQDKEDLKYNRPNKRDIV